MDVAPSIATATATIDPPPLALATSSIAVNGHQEMTTTTTAAVIEDATTTSTATTSAATTTATSPPSRPKQPIEYMNIREILDKYNARAVLQKINVYGVITYLPSKSKGNRPTRVILFFFIKLCSFRINPIINLNLVLISNRW